MTDNPELTKKLAALTEDTSFEYGAMRLGPGSERAALGLILEAIDNTVLPRKLSFEVDGASVVLAVGGRRLSSVLAIGGPLKVDTKLIGALLSNSDSDAITAVEKLLTSLVTRNGAVMLSREIGEGRGGQSDTGVGVATLAEAWNVDPYAEALPRGERLINALGDALIAHGRIVEGSLAGATGREDMVEALRAALSTDVEPKATELDALHKKVSEDRCVTLDGILPDGALLSFATVGNDIFALATVSESWSEIYRYWSKG